MRKNKTNILLNNLDSISNFKVYSKINSEYTKILGNHALKSFIKSLNNPTKVERKTFLKQIAEKYPYKEEQSSINYEQSLLKEKIETKEFLNKLINDSSTQTENSAKKTQNFIISLFRKPPKKDLTPTPCSYNPKYDYIFRRVQVCKITPEKISHNNNSNSDSNSNFVIKRNKLKKIVRNKTNKYNNLLVNKHKQEKKKKDTIDLYNKNYNSFSNNHSNRSIKEQKSEKKQGNTLNNLNKEFVLSNYQKNNKSHKKINLSGIIKKYNKNIKPINHISNFNKKKRNMNLKIFYNMNEINNSGEDFFHKEKKSVIDFRKMPKRNFDIIINKSALKYPSFYKYEPNYDYTFQSSKGFNFGLNENKTNFEKKKFLLKKMWCSYGDLSKDYYFVNNSKLNSSKSNDIFL